MALKNMSPSDKTHADFANIAVPSYKIILSNTSSEYHFTLDKNKLE